MKEMTFVETLVETIREEMERDGRVLFMGQGIQSGGAHKQAVGLFDRFGPERIRDVPISEDTIVGCAVGAAITGMRPIVEIQFVDFALRAMDQIGNQAAKYRYMSGGRLCVPMVIRTVSGFGARRGAQHSQSLEAMFLNFPGLKIANPSTPRDLKGLLKTAIRSDDPVIMMESYPLFGTKGPVPEEDYTIPFGEAEVKREGKDITIVALSAMVREALRAAEDLAKEGIEAEVVDPRTLVPLDLNSIVESVKKSSRLLVVEAGPMRAGVGADIVAQVVERAFDYFDSPPARLAVPDVPIPFAAKMEDFLIPNSARIVEKVRSIIG